ncbi:ankyrin repeat domain-containing protein [Lysobacter humi (ex Lee et al. 2017)]
MPERRSRTGLGVALLLAGIALTAVAVLPLPVAALAVIAAQPPVALGVSVLRGNGRHRPLRHLGALAGLWALAAGGAAALLAWPLAALLRSGSLPAAIAASLAVGIALLLLWPAWPLWSGVERDGDWRAHWRDLHDADRAAWRGAGIAGCVLAVAVAVLLLAWPGLLDGASRIAAVAGVALVAPVLHWTMQRLAPVAATNVAARREMTRESVEPRPAPASTAVDMPDPAPVAPTAPADPAALAVELYAAARGGRVERALALIDAGADVTALPPAGERDRRALPVLAAVLPDLRLLRALIAKGVDLNAAQAGMTPLLAATRDSWHGRPEAVMTLLSNGADPRQRDADGNTALHFAARSTDPGVAALLRDAAAELEAINREGLSPLGMACAAGNWRVAKFLLERGAKPEPPGGQPALIAAAAHEDDDPAGVQLLLRHKARVDAKDPQGRSALHAAAFAGHVEIVLALLDAGADPTLADAQGRTPLMEAARGGHLEVVDELLRHLPDGGAAQAMRVDATGRSLLALACEAEGATPALIERLLALGVDPTLADRDGKRAVDRAAEAGRWSLVAALDAGYRLPAALRDDDDAPLPDRAPIALLREGLQAGRTDLDALLRLLEPADLGLLLHDDDLVLEPAHVAWLLRHGADPEVRDGQGQTPLFVLLGRGPAARRSLRVLLDAAVSPAGRGSLARLLATASAQDPDGEGLALELLDRGADPFGPSRAGDPPLALAIRLGWARLVDRLLATGVALDARDSRGMGALHLAAALGRVDVVKRLVAHGACADLRATDGQTPLGVALASGRRDIAEWLDWRQWPLPRRPLRAGDVPAAAIAGDADAVRRLLDLGLPVDALDRQGCSALLRAAGGGQLAVVDLLLRRGADPGLAAPSGATPLSAAVSMRHLPIVDRLVAAGVPLEQRLPGDLTVLMVACALGLPDLATRLLSAGADVQAVDAQGRGALHCAAMYAFTARDRARVVALLDALLLAGADADAPAAGATALLLALGARAEPGATADEGVLLAVVDQLLAQDVALDARDPRGFGPLHLAALHGLSRVVQRLLQAGADPEMRDSLGRSPREVALMRGYVDIAAEFAPASSPRDISMARFLRDR